jgi:hypothetical protein
MLYPLSYRDTVISLTPLPKEVKQALMCNKALGLLTALNSFKITRQSVDLYNIDRLSAVCYYN